MKSNKPLVSIVCITYNHEEYLDICLKSFFDQKVDFNFEVLIHNDASTDDTKEIIRTYKYKYPDNIKVIDQKENKYSKGERIWFKYLFPIVRGKYIALCEGDDYWIDPLKLSKQVDLMENNVELVGCFHKTKKLFNNNVSKVVKLKIDGGKYNNKDVLKFNGMCISTSSMFFKADIIKNGLPYFFNLAPVGDFPLKLFLTEYGDFGFINEEMSVYRYKRKGSWSSNKEKIIEEHYYQMNLFLEKYKKWTSLDNHKYINHNIKLRRFDYINTLIRKEASLINKIKLLVNNINFYPLRYTLINLKYLL